MDVSMVESGQLEPDRATEPVEVHVPRGYPAEIDINAEH
jgi:hypothetical protein